MRGPVADGGVALADAVWERGAEAMPDIEYDLEPAMSLDESRRRLEGLRDIQNAHVREFLRCPQLRPAVRILTYEPGAVMEDWLERMLEGPDDVVRLQALCVLVKVRASRSVRNQWDVLQHLLTTGRPDVVAVARRIEVAFGTDALDDTLQRSLDPDTSAELQWAVRAAGVTRYRASLGRLAELSRSEDLHVSLAAERSLESFDGPEAIDALAHCVQGWRPSASVRACEALLERDPERLRATLLEVAASDGLYWKGVFLGRLDDPRCVPILCAELPRASMVDAEMFEAIERLAGEDHIAMVESLPMRVRDEQKARATQAVAAVRARLGLAR